MNENTTLALPADDLALVDGKTVDRFTGLKRSARYERIAAGKFPRPLALTARCSRYRAGDIRRWLQDPLGWTPDCAIDKPRDPTPSAKPSGPVAAALH